MNKPDYCRKFFPIDIKSVVKIQYKFFRSIEMHFYGFFQTAFTG